MCVISVEGVCGAEHAHGHSGCIVGVTWGKS